MHITNLYISNVYDSALFKALISFDIKNPTAVSIPSVEPSLSLIICLAHLE
jgi:hypothetical protein